VGVGIVVLGVVARGVHGWTTFAISGTTVALLAVTLLTTPFQAVGEELAYRSVAAARGASWVRAVRPGAGRRAGGLRCGFAVLHGLDRPLLAGYFACVALSTGPMAILSSGHGGADRLPRRQRRPSGVVNNVLSGGGTATVDRATDTGDPSLLILVAVNIGMVALVVVYERRVRRGSGTRSA
jgi:hypothetical protein